MICGELSQECGLCWLHAAGEVYTCPYNTLDMPAGVVPVTKVTAKDIQDMAAYPRTSKLLQAVHKVIRV